MNSLVLLRFHPPHIGYLQAIRAAAANSAHCFCVLLTRPYERPNAHRRFLWLHELAERDPATSSSLIFDTSTIVSTDSHQLGKASPDHLKRTRADKCTSSNNISILHVLDRDAVPRNATAKFTFTSPVSDDAGSMRLRASLIQEALGGGGGKKGKKIGVVYSSFDGFGAFLAKQMSAEHIDFDHTEFYHRVFQINKNISWQETQTPGADSKPQHSINSQATTRSTMQPKLVEPEQNRAGLSDEIRLSTSSSSRFLPEMINKAIISDPLDNWDLLVPPAHEYYAVRVVFRRVDNPLAIDTENPETGLAVLRAQVADLAEIFKTPTPLEVTSSTTVGDINKLARLTKSGVILLIDSRESNVVPSVTVRPKTFPPLREAESRRNDPLASVHSDRPAIMISRAAPGKGIHGESHPGCFELFDPFTYPCSHNYQGLQFNATDCKEHLTERLARFIAQSLPKTKLVNTRAQLDGKKIWFPKQRVWHSGVIV